MVARIYSVISGLHDLIAVDGKARFGNHTIVNTRAVKLRAPVLVGCTDLRIGELIFCIEEAFCYTAIGFTVFGGVQIPDNDRGQSAELCDFVKHYADTVNARRVADMV